jgi:hypothetical protein
MYVLIKKRYDEEALPEPVSAYIKFMMINDSSNNKGLYKVIFILKRLLLYESLSTATNKMLIK